MRRSLFVSMIAVLASLNVVLDSIAGIPQLVSGVWYSWGFLIEPLNGILLGPYAGFFSTLIGVMIGHYIYYIDFYEFLFTIGAPLGAMISGLMFKRKWKLVLIYYTLLLLAYFLTPIAWQLPWWGIWDIYCAYIMLIVVNVLRVKNIGKTHMVLLCAFIGLEADVLFRIFVFIPCQTYSLFYGFTIEVLQIIWVSGAIVTPLQIAISVIFTTIVGTALLQTLEKFHGI